MVFTKNATKLGRRAKKINSYSQFSFPTLLAFVVALAGAVQAETPELTPRQMVQWLFKHAAALEDISFKDLAEAASNKRVLAISKTDTHDQALLAHIQAAADKLITVLNSAQSPTKGLRRINEASKQAEDILVKSLNTGEFSCQFPRNAKGAMQRSGYPDLEITHKPSGKISYLDPKLFEATSRESSLRTFYFEPREHTLKITKDARHLLLGIAHDGKDGTWRFISYDLVDLSLLKVRLKAEFDASNKAIYTKDSLLLQKKESDNKSAP